MGSRSYLFQWYGVDIRLSGPQVFPKRKVRLDMTTAPPEGHTPGSFDLTKIWVSTWAVTPVSLLPQPTSGPLQFVTRLSFCAAHAY